MWSRDPSQSQPQPLVTAQGKWPQRGKRLPDVWEKHPAPPTTPLPLSSGVLTLVCLPGRNNAAAGRSAATGLSSALQHYPGLHLDEAPLSLQKAG